MRRILGSALALTGALCLFGCGDDAESGGGGAGEAGAPAGGAGQGGSAEGGAGGAGGETWDAKYDPLVAALLADMEASGAYGVSVAVMEHGEVTFVHAFGSKDAAGTKPLETTTLMQIGSTTKQMTATALLRKVEAGDVSLDDTLEEALPEMDFAADPAWDDAIHLRDLLDHSAGLADLTEWVGSSNDGFLASRSYGAFANTGYVMNPPGVFWNYSNPNFILAGLIAETLDTRSYPDLMKEDLFAPLGMSRTFLRKADVEADGDYAESFGVTPSSPETPGEVTMEEQDDSAWVRPAGLAWTTPEQMMSWAKFVMHGDPTVLSDAMRAEITTEHMDTLFEAGNLKYGFGMFLQQGYVAEDGAFYETPIWQHGGNTLSFSNELWMIPETDFAIVITSSAFIADFNHSVDVALTTLADLPAPSGDAPAYTIDPDAFDAHVGDYYDPFNLGQVIVTRDGDSLLVSMPDVEAAGYDVAPELVAISSDIFVATVAGQAFDLTFIPETPGGPSQYIRNRSFVVTRSAATAAPSQHPTSLDPARLERILSRAASPEEDRALARVLETRARLAKRAR